MGQPAGGDCECETAHEHEEGVDSRSCRVSGFLENRHISNSCTHGKARSGVSVALLVARWVLKFSTDPV